MAISTYDKMCLVNKAVYIARYKNKDGTLGDWTATGTQFAVPYVFKTLFSKEPIDFDDMCETKSVSTALYLDMNEGLSDSSQYKKELSKIENKDGIKFGAEERAKELHKLIEDCHDYHFVGKVGRFCPIEDGKSGGILLREVIDSKSGSRTGFAAVNDTDGFRWLEAEKVKELGKENDIERFYYDELVNKAVEEISKYGDFERFVSDDPYVKAEEPPT